MSFHSEHYDGWRWAVTGWAIDGQPTRHLHVDEGGRDMEIAAFKSRRDIVRVTIAKLTAEGEVEWAAPTMFSALELFRAATDSATPGPWTVETRGGTDSTGEGWFECEVGFSDPAEPNAGLMMGDHEQAEADAQWIATARDITPRLLRLYEDVSARHTATSVQHFLDGPRVVCAHCRHPYPCPDLIAARTVGTG